ncbi:uncharacterized protein BDR25DRAFT_346857 [Lindgomyces ingoldianus]|uniref:Uncharacterized protein n=1 Tax=Lindgomyces ingoldianus TaxID=673940 RepID=A0ACB6QAR6_9PLEO|nr:uncharacterized protein BDR25DRAFT_346857 [Lindgomyces ingoldianus]KAF2464028.1 hypothetical protein BDR25DRAFT_346857 [Lindgomyces ingoldianus]
MSSSQRTREFIESSWRRNSNYEIGQGRYNRRATNSRALGSQYAGRISDPDLSRHDILDVSITIQEELDAHLPSFRKALAEEVHSSLEKYTLTAHSAPSTDILPPEDVARLASQDAQIARLEKDLEKLKSENLALGEDLQKATSEKNAIAGRFRISDSKVRRLQSVILENGLGPSGLDDEDIQRRFQRLRFDILQLVKKYCVNRNAHVKDPRYSRLSDEAKDFWVMKMIARGLHKHCFNEKTYFGFDADTDAYLNRFYRNLYSHKSVSLEDVAEWRVRTCLIGKSWDTQGLQRQARIEGIITVIANKLTPFMPSGWLPSLDKNNASKDVKASLLPICESALNLAIMFSSSKTEYEWAQGGDLLLDPSHVQVIGTAGYKSFVDSREDYVVAFGGVLKGSGLQGRLDDNPVHLSDTEVILGPFP